MLLRLLEQGQVLVPKSPDNAGTRYDAIGQSYRTTRQPEPRIAAAILEALGDARSVANIGAGAGSYEPTDRVVLSVEPSATMIVQRPASSPPAIRARAEQLPLGDKSFDATLAVNTLHHWGDLRAGLREMRRVARKRVVIFHRDANAGTPFWLTEDYLPAIDPSRRLVSIADEIVRELCPAQITAVPLPRLCQDGLFSAYWGRPESYLDGEVRNNISNFALACVEQLETGLGRLDADLRSGAWDRKYGELRSLAELDLGHRLIVAEFK